MRQQRSIGRVGWVSRAVRVAVAAAVGPQLLAADQKFGWMRP